MAHRDSGARQHRRRRRRRLTARRRPLRSCALLNAASHRDTRPVCLPAAQALHPRRHRLPGRRRRRRSLVGCGDGIRAGRAPPAGAAPARGGRLLFRVSCPGGGRQLRRAAGAARGAAAVRAEAGEAGCGIDRAARGGMCTAAPHLCTALLPGVAACAQNGLPISPSISSSQVLCGSEEQLREAQQEVAVMRRLRHPCLLPLLDAAVQRQRTPDGAVRHVVLMLFPGALRRLGCLFPRRRQVAALRAFPIGGRWAACTHGKAHDLASPALAQHASQCTTRETSLVSCSSGGSARRRRGALLRSGATRSGSSCASCSKSSFRWMLAPCVTLAVCECSQVVTVVLSCFAVLLPNASCAWQHDSIRLVGCPAAGLRRAARHAQPGAAAGAPRREAAERSAPAAAAGGRRQRGRAWQQQGGRGRRSG